jgi:hypothetical protein
MSWTHNFDDPAGDVNVGRVFDFEDDDPTLNQLSVFIESAIAASPDKFDIGFRLEPMWGGDARFIHSNGLFDYHGFSAFPGSPGTGDGPDEQFDLVQAYLTLNIPVGNGMLLKAGKFVTMHGYETINPTTNPLYSHTYLFNFAIPFTHTGVMLTYPLNKNWSVTGGVLRGWEQALEDNNDMVSFCGQVLYTGERVDLYFNLITGPEQADNEDDYRTVFDFSLVWRATDRLTLVVNPDFGWESDAGSDSDYATWYGAAGYAIYKINDHLSAVGRLEYFNDDDGARGLGTSVVEATLGLNIMPMRDHPYGSGLLIRPELRWDHASDDIFDGGGDDNQFTFGIDLVYSF